LPRRWTQRCGFSKPQQMNFRDCKGRDPAVSRKLLI
jgi:hypothetical protein